MLFTSTVSVRHIIKSTNDDTLSRYNVCIDVTATSVLIGDSYSKFRLKNET